MCIRDRYSTCFSLARSLNAVSDFLYKRRFYSLGTNYRIVSLINTFLGTLVRPLRLLNDSPAFEFFHDWIWWRVLCIRGYCIRFMASDIVHGIVFCGIMICRLCTTFSFSWNDIVYHEQDNKVHNMVFHLLVYFVVTVPLILSTECELSSYHNGTVLIVN